MTKTIAELRIRSVELLHIVDGIEGLSDFPVVSDLVDLIAAQQAKIEELEKENLAELDKEYCNGFRAGHNHGLDEALAMRVGDLGGRRTIHKLPPDVATILATRMLTPPKDDVK